MKTFLRDIGRNRQARGQRLVFAAERTIELAQEIGTETGSERRTRQIEDVADAFQADARQRGDGLVRQPQRWERQWRKTFTRLATRIRHGLRIAEARGSGGCADAGGNGGARRQAQTRHPREEIVAKLFLAAKKMRAAADVEQDAVGRIDGDERGVALAGIGDGVEQARVGVLVFRNGGERRMHGAGLRQGETGGESEPLCRDVDREQEIEVAALADHDEGGRRLTPLPCDAVGRKLLQP